MSREEIDYKIIEKIAIGIANSSSYSARDIKWVCLEILDFDKLQSKLAQKDAVIAEMSGILKDFLTTEVCHQTWVDEMHATIDIVLKELEGE